ncbi:MAG: ribosome maturation factor RimP [Campylobacteraceae bacterium]|jgi:ribosome maturation factor RimP|nr:ribosome maturation factor RimP [Campylobacteraceae bacterium]
MNNEEIKKIVESFGATLYDVELVPMGEGGHIFRVSVQKEGGVDLDLCADINAVLSPYLDTNPPVKGKYYLEVGSPGIERSLKNIAHFEKSIGELVRMSLKDGTKLKGKLLGIKDGVVEIETQEGNQKVSFGDISKARTYFEWK